MAPMFAASADEGTGAESSTVVTDFRGRPPFKRQRISSAEAAELARFEEAAAPPASGQVRVVNFRGRPPFRREVLTAEEFASLARFEETSTDSESRRTRRGAPGKATSRR